MIRVDMSAPIATVHGDPLNYTASNGKPAQWTLGRVCREALMLEKQDQSAEAKLRCWKLAMQITDAEVSLTPEDYVLLKECIGRMPTVFCGPALSLLESAHA